MVDRKKHEHAAPPDRLALPAMGLEAEFSLVLDGQPVRPEDVFASPRDFIRGELMHRQGKSYHLPTGGAVYFDTGVIEVATPVIELAPGCAARAGRQLWEAIQFVRAELDAWDARHGRRTRLVGFSAHYNVSYGLPDGEAANGRTIDDLARLLTHILPAPVMLLATNKASTGVGVRPRTDRIEITSDFTPNPALMIAAATVIVGVVREVMGWPGYGMEQLDKHGIPVIQGFAPMPHTSRKGWLARMDCYPENPFAADPDAVVWDTHAHGRMSLRGIAQRITRRFVQPVLRYADPSTARLILNVLRGERPSLLDLEERPEAYEDVGRLCAWDPLSAPAQLERSKYEEVVRRAIAGLHLRLAGRQLQPVGMRGWSGIVFQDDAHRRTTMAIDDLVAHVRRWGHG
jgi:hypothetical protein